MNNIKKISIAFLLVFSLGFSFVNSPVFAADNLLKTQNIPGTSDTNALIKCDGTTENPCGVTQFITLIQSGLNLSICIRCFYCCCNVYVCWIFDAYCGWKHVSNYKSKSSI
jgi:hypothetical protein